MVLNVHASLFGATGYDAHSWGLLNAFLEAGNEAAIASPLVPNWEFKSNRHLIKALTTPQNPRDPTLAITLPPMWPSLISNRPKKFYGFLIWEGDKVPANIAKYAMMADKILVPSTHTWRAASVGGIPQDKLAIVPHGVDHRIFKPGVHIPFFERLRQNKFTFIANKGWNDGLNDRGGMQWVIKAFCEEFKSAEPVALTVKINAAYGGNVKAMIDELQLPADRPQVQFVLQNTDYNQLPGFYNLGNCFVSASMAEAFNLPCIEALACGVPVIAPEFGGQADYVTDQNGWPITGGEYVPARGLLYEGVRWLKPDIAELRASMRLAYDDRQGLAVRAEEAVKSTEGWDWTDSAKKLSEVVKE